MVTASIKLSPTFLALMDLKAQISPDPDKDPPASVPQIRRSFKTFESRFNKDNETRMEAEIALQPLLTLTQEALTKKYQGGEGKTKATNAAARLALKQLWTETLSPAIKKLKNFWQLNPSSSQL